MRRLNGVMRTTLACLVVATTAVVATATVSAEPASGEPDWRSCEENPEVECASVTVPIDWAHPDRGTIEVAIARHRATDRDARVGTLVYLPGGPGGSGVDQVLSGSAVTEEVTARFDVVGIDPRGTNRSNPVRCDADLLAARPNAVPDAGGTFAELKAYSEKLGKSCRERTGPLVDHVDNVSTAHDIDAVRAALGEETISLYGTSYGTLTGQMYAENHPRRVRGMILDSVFDHSLDTRRFLTTEAAGAEDAFEEFAAWCARDTACALHGRDVGRVFDDVYARAVAGDLHWPNDPDASFEPMTLITGIGGKFYGPSWAEAAELLKSLADQTRVPARTADAAESAPFPVGSLCADHEFDISSERQWVSLWRKQNEVAPHMRSHFAWPLVSLCAAWPARTPNPQHRTDVDGGPEILVMNALHDPATPHTWARSVADQIDRGVLLTYEGWGHRVVGRGDCTIEAANRYLIDGVAPEKGARCAAVPPTQEPQSPQSPSSPGRW